MYAPSIYIYQHISTTPIESTAYLLPKDNINTHNQLTTASGLLCLPRRKKTTRHQLEFSGPPIVAI